MLREHNRRIGLGLALAGFFLLLSLRWWTSPIARRITGRQQIQVTEFLLIPVFFLLVGAGILLFLWEPERRE